MISFAEKVWNAARKIPRGKVATYAQIARMIGHPRAARAVGNALNKNKYSYLVKDLSANRRVPCHRVVCSDGSLGGFAFGTKKKQALLAQEGVLVRKGKVDLRRYSFSSRAASRRRGI